MEYSFVLHMVHVAGTRMIAQGMDGLLRGSFQEGVPAGHDMLAFVDLMQTAWQRYPPILDFVQDWLNPSRVEGKGPSPIPVV